MAADTGKGLSAAGAKKIVHRAQKVRQIEPPTVYTITDASTRKKHKGTFKTVAALCPKVKTSTLKRRLESGTRDLETLRLPPQSKQGARSRRARR